MYNLKDKVKVTERAKKNTYNNDWWTEKELIIDHVEKEHDLSDEGQGLYSFVTVDGEEVPCSLYDYELELIESSVPGYIQERLNHTYELVEYNVDANIDKDREVEFLEYVVDGFSTICKSLQGVIMDNMEPFFNDLMQDKLGYAFYIKYDIDDFLDGNGANTLEEALNGGIREYLFSQFFSNAEAVYKNLIYMKLNCIAKNIKGKYDKSMLADLKTMFLSLESSEVEELVDDFVNIELDSSCIYGERHNDLYMEFCEFVSGKIEE